MDVVITEWSLNSYLDLKHAQVFSDQEYHSVLRPDADGRFHATEPVNFIQRIHPISWVGAT